MISALCRGRRRRVRGGYSVPTFQFSSAFALFVLSKADDLAFHCQPIQVEPYNTADLG
jgi:hypothetical protein